MAVKMDFDIGNFITNSLCLHTNISPTARLQQLNPSENKYEKFLKQNPFDLLDERLFTESAKVPEEVVGTEVQEFYRGAAVLITGGTGFVGKLLTEKLIRSMPHLRHVYLLIRDKRNQSAQERFETLLEDKVFRRMREEVPWYFTKITVVAGDLHSADLGLSPAARQMLIDKVQVVFHVAADVKFTEPLKAAVESNVYGTQRVANLAAQMPHLKSFVHVSTAFSQSVRKVIPECIPRMNLPYTDVLKHINTHGDDPQDSETIRLMQGWPNTYAFSKALCEIMLEEEYNHLPISIFRPSVIFPTYHEPVRGWTDNLYGPIANMAAVGMGVMHTYKMDVSVSIDIVPADFVVNAMIVVARDTANLQGFRDIKVFNYTTQSPQRLRSWKHMFAIGGQCVKRWPYGKSVWYISYNCHDNQTIVAIKHFLLHKVPAWVIDKLLLLSGRKPRLMDIWRKVEDLTPSMHYFVSNCFEFQNTNTMELWRSLGDADKSLFNFDVGNFDTAELTLLAFIGTKYYMFKDSESLATESRRYRRLYWLHTAVKTVWWYAVLSAAVWLARALPL